MGRGGGWRLCHLRAPRRGRGRPCALRPAPPRSLRPPLPTLVQGLPEARKSEGRPRGVPGCGTRTMVLFLCDEALPTCPPGPPPTCSPILYGISPVQLPQPVSTAWLGPLSSRAQAHGPRLCEAHTLMSLAQGPLTHLFSKGSPPSSWKQPPPYSSSLCLDSLRFHSLQQPW